MNLLMDVRCILASVLSLGDRATILDEQAELLGAIPELDSMAVVTVVTALEERFGIVFEDEEITAEAFETLGSLCRLVGTKVGLDSGA